MSREATITEGPEVEPELPAAKTPTRRVADPELIAMSEIIGTIESLEPDAQTRVSRWLFDRWGYGSQTAAV